VAIAGILLFLNNPLRAEDDRSFKERLKELDYLGAIVLVAAVVCLLLALQWGGTKYSWNSGVIVGLLCAFGVIIILFIYIEYHLGDGAAVPPRLLMHRTTFFSSMFSFCSISAFFVLQYYLPLYFQGVKGDSASSSGIRILPILLSVAIGSIVWGVIVSIVGYFTPFMIVGASIYTIGLGLISTLGANTKFGACVAYQLVSGIGLGMCLQVIVELQR
jgi:Fungal trichothecene efflux pump (TRI12)